MELPISPASPTFEHPKELQFQAAPLKLFNANLPVASREPEWRTRLEQSIRHCNDMNSYYVSLATIKSFGRPANRTIFFRGFMTQSVGTNDAEIEGEQKPDSKKGRDGVPMTTSMDVLKLSSAAKAKTINDVLGNVLVFVVDARSGSVGDILHGIQIRRSVLVSLMTCRFMHETKEQYRISGALHLVMSADHSLHKSHKVPMPFTDHTTSRPNVDWEAVRLKVWENISSLRRASFAWPHPGHDRETIYAPVHLPSLLSPSTHNAVLDGMNFKRSKPTTDPANLSPVQPSVNPLHLDMLSTVSPSPYDDTELSNLKHGQIASDGTQFEEIKIQKHHHDIAWSNFCLLLLDVDGVDHLNISTQPHTRTKYRQISPAMDEAMYLSQAHHRQTVLWETWEVNP
ncbi:hypothetical protein BASA60_000147 [Batrachochytrium salamandrivorans]|nr:hypothetical protein BASA60_000147 [Batrachochytrium salamandrivorans]